MAEEIVVETDKTVAEEVAEQLAGLTQRLDERDDELVLERKKVEALEAGLKADPARSEVDAAIADQSLTRDAEGRVLTGGEAGRTIPASLAPYRYRALGPAGAFRNPDTDVLCQRWFRALRDKDGNAITAMQADDQKLRAALAIGTPGANFGISDGSGGQLLPLPLADYLQRIISRNARVRSHARVFDAPIGAGDSLRVAIQDVRSTVSYGPESGTNTETGPEAKIAVKLSLVKLLGRGDVTDELLDSTAFNVGEWFSTDIGENMAEFEDLKMWQDGAGNASDEPEGLEASDTTTTGPNLPAYYVPVATDQDADFTAAGTLTADHLLDMYFAAPERHRQNMIWAGPDSVALLLSKLIVNGRAVLNLHDQPLATVGDVDAAGQVSTVLGKPFINMPGKEGVGEDANRLYFIRMDRAYFILERGQIRAKVSTDVRFLEDETVFTFSRMADGRPAGNKTAGLPFDYVYSGNLN